MQDFWRALRNRGTAHSGASRERSARPAVARTPRLLRQRTDGSEAVIQPASPSPCPSCGTQLCATHESGVAPNTDPARPLDPADATRHAGRRSRWRRPRRRPSGSPRGGGAGFICSTGGSPDRAQPHAHAGHRLAFFLEGGHFFANCRLQRGQRIRGLRADRVPGNRCPGGRGVYPAPWPEAPARMVLIAQLEAAKASTS
jgi:hypothetical protein